MYITLKIKENAQKKPENKKSSKGPPSFWPWTHVHAQLHPKEYDHLWGQCSKLQFVLLAKICILQILWVMAWYPSASQRSIGCTIHKLLLIVSTIPQSLLSHSLLQRAVHPQLPISFLSHAKWCGGWHPKSHPKLLLLLDCWSTATSLKLCNMYASHVYISNVSKNTKLLYTYIYPYLILKIV